jgi:hypothetical protein
VKTSFPQIYPKFKIHDNTQFLHGTIRNLTSTLLSKLLTEEKHKSPCHKIRPPSVIWKTSPNRLFILTDCSKDQIKNAGFAHTIPKLKLNHREKLSPYTPVFALELLGIKSALRFIKLEKLEKKQSAPCSYPL